MKDIKKLINNYIKFLHTNFEIEKLEKNIYKITTPFLDRRNDHITIYAMIKNEEIILTDDGYTIDDLIISGLSLTPKREKELETILIGYGVYRKKNELYTVANEKNFAQKKHSLIQALISINDMYLLSTERVTSFFLEDIKSFFDEKELIYTENISLEGKSKIIHKFDFLIPKQVTKYKKEALIKAINNPKLENIKAILFSFEDVKNAGRMDKDFIILNDKNNINNNIYKLLNTYAVHPIHWSNINKDYKKLISA